MDREIFNQAVNTIANTLGDYLPVAAIATGQKQFHNSSEQLFALLDEVISYNPKSQRLNFHAQAAISLIQDILDRIPAMDLIELHQDNANLGIYEKVLKKQCSNQEWLTDLDIRRALELLQLKDIVKITRFNALDIAMELHFAREKHQNATEPYTVSLIVNKGAAMSSQGMHWFAINFIVDPIRKIVNCDISESAPLSDQEKAVIGSILKEAVNYIAVDKVAHVEKIYHAFPDFNVYGQFCEVKQQADGYSCGYRALHALCQNSSLAKNKPEAQKYGQLPASSDVLTQHLMNLMLTGMQLKMSMVQTFNNELQADFKRTAGTTDQAHIGLQAAKQTVFDLTLEQPSVKMPEKEHPIVSDVLSKYKANTRSITFPAQNQHDLSAGDYKDFYHKLTDKLEKNRRSLSQLFIQPCDNASIEALSAFASDINHCPFEQITLKVEQLEDTDDFINKLKTALVSLSVKNLNTLTFQDAQGLISTAQWQDIAEFVVNNSAVTTEMLLPENYLKTPIQKTIDIATSNHAHQKIQSSNKSIPEKRKSDHVAGAARVKRTRANVDAKEAIDIDIEQEQEQQVEVDQEQKTEQNPDTQIEGSIVELPRKEFERELLQRNLGLQSEKYFFDIENHNTLAYLKNFNGCQTITNLWDVWFGNISSGNNRSDSTHHARGVSRAAVKRILQFPEQFTMGVDYYNLPPGFLMVDHPRLPGEYLLHYDQHTQDITERKRFSVFCIPQKVLPTLSYQLFSEVLKIDSNLAQYNDENIETKYGYDRNKSQLLRTYCPELLSLNSDDQNALLNLKPEQLKLLFQNADQIKATFPNGFDPKCKPGADAIIEILNDKAPFEASTKAVQAIKVLCGAVNHPADENHILLSVLETSENLHAETKTWLGELRLSKRSMNALLRVYDLHGENGLKRLYAQWSSLPSERMKNFYESLLAQHSDFSFMINDEHDRVVQRINALDGHLYQWWELLSKKHAKYVAREDIPSLFEDFIEFTDRIEQQGLKFYPLKHNAFQDTSNMRVAFSRMLKILDHSSETDREAQWQCMSQISLQSDAAIRAIEDNNCAFVLPEMRCDGSLFYFSQDSKAHFVGYRSQVESVDYDDKWHAIANLAFDDYKEEEERLANEHAQKNVFARIGGVEEVSDPKVKSITEDLTKNAYRYLAHCQYKMPITFYQQAFAILDEKVKKISDKRLRICALSRLSAILVNSTSSKNNEIEVGPDSIEEKLQQWESITECLTNPPKPKAIPAFLFNRTKTEFNYFLLDEVFSLKRMPSLSYVHVLTNVIKDKVTNAPLLNMQENGQYLKNLLIKLKILLSNINTELFSGTKFYPGKSTDLDSYINKLWTIFCLEFLSNTPNAQLNDLRQLEYLHDQGHYHKVISSRLGWLLVESISTFDLSEDQITELYAFERKEMNILIPSLNSRHITELKSDFYKLIKGFNTNCHPDGTKFTVEDFKSFWSDYKDFVIKNFPNKLRCMRVRNQNDEKTLQAGITEYRAITVKNFVAEKMGGALPEGFLTDFYRTRLKQNQFDEAKKKHLKNLNKDIIEKISTQFIELNIDSNESFEHLNRCFSDLRNILECYGTLGAQQTFLKVFFSTIDVKQYRIDDLSQLIATVKKRGAHNDLVFILSNDAAKESLDIVSKATTLIDRIIPDIEAQAKLSAGLSIYDGLPIATQLVLKEDPNQLNRSFDIDFYGYGKLNELFHKAKHSKDVDLDMLIDQIVCFLNKVPNRQDYPQLTELYNALMRANAPKIAEKDFSAYIKEQGQDLVNRVSSWASSLWSSSKTKVQDKNDPIKNPKPKPAIEDDKIVPIMEAISKGFLSNNLLVKVDTELEDNAKKHRTYSGLCNHYLRSLHQLTANTPGAKSLIINLLDSFVKSYQGHQPLTIAANEFVNTLLDEFSRIKDPDMIRALCFHFQGTEGEYTPHTLVDQLFASINKAPEQKAMLLAIAVDLMNNDKSFILADFQSLVELSKNPKHAARIKEVYQTAPYPEIQDLLQWHKDAQSSGNYEANWNAKYKAFDKHPCDREPDNGFKLDVAKTQAKILTGINYPEKDLEYINDQTKAVQEFSVQKLLDELRQFKDQTKPDHARLVAIVAELMYRAKGSSGGFGQSFELNTTQYISALSLLDAGEHVTAQIATGEGKSRIMMITNACQYALGKTVDFVTSDVDLATRDYLEYQAFFKLIGAKTNLITASSMVSDYQMDGINFSDASSLSLFRNRAITEGCQDEVLNPDPTKRGLLLDEADKTYFDMSDTRFNYSGEGDISIRGMEWIYPLLVEFFIEDEGMLRISDFYSDIDACNESFFQFMALKNLSNEQQQQLAGISQEQLETWHKSAITALQLEHGIHYNIKRDTVIKTPRGPIKASAVKLIAEGRELLGARFSFGVHQCLSARLNYLRKHGSIQYPKLAQSVNEDHCQHEFYIEPEKQIIYSSSSKGLLDDYQQGTLKGVTGTTGSIKEQEEASVLYGHSAKQDSKMKFVDIPRHKGLKRLDKPTLIADDFDEYIQKIVNSIVDSSYNKQPVLVICRNDIESQKVHKRLAEVLSRLNISLQLIDSTLDEKERTRRVEQAGTEGTVTISTTMIGRGTDIKLQGQAKSSGLKTLVAYLPRYRDMLQIIGRSGRYGARGISQMILNRQTDKVHGKSVTMLELRIRSEQIVMDHKHQSERLIKNLKSTFYKELHDLYFSNTRGLENRVGPWSTFIKDADQLWSTTMPKIIAELDQYSDQSLANIDKLLSEYTEQVKSKWQVLSNTISTLTADSLQKIDLSRISLPKLHLNETTNDLINNFNLAKALADSNDLVQYIADKLTPTNKRVDWLKALTDVETYLAELTQHDQFKVEYQKAMATSCDNKTAIAHDNKEIYQIIKHASLSQSKSLLGKYLNARLAIEGDAPKLDKLLIEMIKQSIIDQDWQVGLFGGVRVEGFNNKLPTTVAKIYKAINEAEAKPETNYSELLDSVLTQANNAGSSKFSFLWLNRRQKSTQTFYDILRTAFEDRKGMTENNAAKTKNHARFFNHEPPQTVDNNEQQTKIADEPESSSKM